MHEDQKGIEDLLVKVLSYILKRTTEVNTGDQLSIAQEYREWINCIAYSDFTRQEILLIDKYTFN